MRNQNAFLIIDAQYDFCNPNGALYVTGAEKDMQRLKKIILDNLDKIDNICVTIDSHPVNDISHPSFWQDKDGKNPAPFTQITLKEVNDGTWTPRFYPDKAIKYLADLEAQGEFPHFIWPEHCLMGSKGGALDDTLMEALKAWTYTGKYYQAVTKGTYPLTEHFGIFMAQIPVADRPETQLNQGLIKTLETYQNVFIAGEAKSHCVATSIKQAINYAPALAGKMVIIEDCMSDVPGLGHLGEPIYQLAKSKGLRFTDSASIRLN
jgi:nicotinamidase/pyrazinamidase